MSPIGPYDSFEDCIAKNGDKSSPEGFCSWLEHKITGKWPSGMTAGMFPDPWLSAYDVALVAGKPEKEAFDLAKKATIGAGFEMSRQGWVKQFQSPKCKAISGVKIFAVGTWTDSAGIERTWTPEDLDRMVDAFTAGVPAMVPIKCGHTSDGFNKRIAEALEVPPEIVTGDEGHGQIKLGSMTSLQRKGSLLIAAFDKVPEAIANLIEGGQYATVSVEIEDSVGDFGPVITGVALLGAEEPAVDEATLERSLVFAKRPGARVLSFEIGDDIPTIKGRLKAAFATIGDLLERLVGKPEIPAPGTAEAEPQKAASEQGKTNLDEGGNMELLKKLAAALGLGEAATEQDVLAAIAELMKKGAMPAPEMAKELQKANDKIAALEASAKGQSALSAWKEKTVTLTAIPGTPAEHAVKLAVIEAKAGKEAADSQFAVLEATNKLAQEAQKIIGTSRVAGPTDFDNEVTKYMKESKVDKAAAIKAVSKARPDLYFARPERQ